MPCMRIFIALLVTFGTTFVILGSELREPKLLMNSGAPGAIPTRDLPLRRRTLYATELREHERVDSKSSGVNK